MSVGADGEPTGRHPVDSRFDSCHTHRHVRLVILRCVNVLIAVEKPITQNSVLDRVQYDSTMSLHRNVLSRMLNVVVVNRTLSLNEVTSVSCAALAGRICSSINLGMSLLVMDAVVKD